MPVVDHTVLKGYFENGKVPHEDNYIDLIDTLGGLEEHNHDSDYHRKDENIINNNGMRIGSAIVTPTPGMIFANDYVIAMGGLYAGFNSDPGTGVIRATQSIHAGSYIAATDYINTSNEYRIDNNAVGVLNPFDTSTFKASGSWDGGDTYSAGVYTITPETFGYAATAKALYVLLGGRKLTTSAELYLNDDSNSFEAPLFTRIDTSYRANSGIVKLNSSGNMYLRIVGAGSDIFVKIQIWGEFI